LVSASDDVTVECLGAEVKVFTADVSDDRSQSLVNAIGSGNVVGAAAAGMDDLGLSKAIVRCDAMR
jgi:xanthine dehydrogenase molybdopterin-binding subunit B